MNPLVSISVPVYNVAPYIERCVRSLMEQDYDNIEYVFVNDGSTDDSVGLLEQVVAEYPHRQSAVHIYHNDKNHGLAYTRRKSIENATGDYITCVDSDDWIDKNYVSCLVKEALRSEAEMVIALFIENWSDQRSIVHDFDSLRTSLPANYLVNHCTALWGKLYLRKWLLAHPMYAPEGLDYGEDRIVMLQMEHYVHTISTISDSAYHYVHQSQSITSVKTDKHFDCLIRYWQEAERLMRGWGVWEQNMEDCYRQQVEDKIALMLQCASNQTRRKYADLYRENEIANLKGLSPGFQLMGILVHYHLWPLISLHQVYIDWLIKRKNK
ncbi:MAG: glycosyltransferase [Paludibacteraceae bacterium]|nr:glycosyltransferase [Paludibacteraceae bacterium]